MHVHMQSDETKLVGRVTLVNGSCKLPNLTVSFRKTQWFQCGQALLL